jgi:hypothetical protein
MLAGMRSRFLLSCLFAFSLAAFLPIQAQVNGVPPSITSMGFGGRLINGVPPSVTSIGFGGRAINGAPPIVTSLEPNGYGSDWSVLGNCCWNFFFPANPPLSSGHHRHHHADHGSIAVGIMEPAYIPYAPDSGTDDDSLEADASQSSAPLPLARRVAGRDSTPQTDADTDSQLTSAQPPEDPVSVQPSTVLVFKDGHQADVLNYAIVGDTLFDFADGRTRKILLADLDLKATHKANDDRGVDFQLPAGPIGQ